MNNYDKKLFPHIIDGDPVSNLHVMQSAAGYYLGRTYFDLEIGHPLPYSRESSYYRHHHDAKQALKYNAFMPRDCIENNWMYSHHPELIPY